MKLHCVLATALICISVVFECRASEEGDANPEVVPQDSDGGMKSAPESKLNVEASVFHSKEEMEAARPQSASAIKWAEVDDTGCGAHLSFFANFDLNVECKSVCDGLFEAAKKLCPDVNLVLGSTSDTGTNKGAQDGDSMHSAGDDSDTDSLHSAPVTSDSDHDDGKDLDSVQQPPMAGAKEEDGSSLASQPEEACKRDADCPGDDGCIGHKCSRKSCKETTECAQGLTCFKEKCKVAIGSDVACLSDAECEGYNEGGRSIVCGMAHWSSKHKLERQQERGERCCERVDHDEESTDGVVIDDPTCCSRKRRGNKCCVQPGGLHDEHSPKVCCSGEFEEFQDEEFQDEDQEAAKTGHGRPRQKVCKSMQSANADGKSDGEDPDSVPPTPKGD